MLYSHTIVSMPLGVVLSVNKTAGLKLVIDFIDFSQFSSFSSARYQAILSHTSALPGIFALIILICLASVRPTTSNYKAHPSFCRSKTTSLTGLKWLLGRLKASAIAHAISYLVICSLPDQWNVPFTDGSYRRNRKRRCKKAVSPQTNFWAGTVQQNHPERSYATHELKTGFTLKGFVSVDSYQHSLLC